MRRICMCLAVVLVVFVGVTATAEERLLPAPAGPSLRPPERLSGATDMSCATQYWYDPTASFYVLQHTGTDAGGPERWLATRFESAQIVDMPAITVTAYNFNPTRGRVIVDVWDDDGPFTSCGWATPGTNLRHVEYPVDLGLGYSVLRISLADEGPLIWGADDGSTDYLFVSVGFHPDPGITNPLGLLAADMGESGCGTDPHTVIQREDIPPGWYYAGEVFGLYLEAAIDAELCPLDGCWTQSWFDPAGTNWEEYDLFQTGDPFWRRLGVRFDMDGAAQLRGFWVWLIDYGIPWWGDLRTEVWADNGPAVSCGLPTPGSRAYGVSGDPSGLVPGWNYFPIEGPHIIQSSDGPNSMFATLSFLNPFEPLKLLGLVPPDPGCGGDPHSIIRIEGGDPRDWRYLGEWPDYPYQAELKMIADFCPAPVTFTASETMVRFTGPAVTFTADATIPIASYSWSFGDGATSTDPAPVHKYNTPGRYTVVLNVTDTDGATYLAYRINYIYVGGLLAEFSATPRAGLAPLSVAFTDESIGSPTDWLWDFGDGNTSTDQHPVHSYANPGLYSVTLALAKTNSPIGPDTDIMTKTSYVYVATEAQPNIEVTVHGLDLARPGFEKCYQVTAQNTGPVATAGGEALTLILPLDPATTYVSSNPPGTYVPGGAGTNAYIAWTLPVLAPLQVNTYEACMRISELATSGQWLNVVAEAEVNTGEYADDNTAYDDEEIRSSWDPNDKFASPAGCGPERAIGGDDRLSYQIFFENKAEATADAIYVLVVDTLDLTLDWNTLQLGPTSHDDVVTFDFDPASREMTWFFDHINLPPNVNPPEGEGFVSYTIKPMAGLPQGTVIPNRAHIRFDYNPWIAAPEAGPITRTVLACCECPCHGDPICDGELNVLDVITTVQIAFGGDEPLIDRDCDHEPAGRTDVNCDGVTNSLDVVTMVKAVFRGMTDAICDPCAP